jgi:hypothetical protein
MRELEGAKSFCQLVTLSNCTNTIFFKGWELGKVTHKVKSSLKWLKNGGEWMKDQVDEVTLHPLPSDRMN